MMRTCFVLLAMLCVSGAARASIEDAERHYSRLEYDKALVALRAARRQVAGDPQQLAKIWLLEGYVQIGLNRADEATAAFRNALRAWPSARPPSETSPKIMDVFVKTLQTEQQRSRRRAAVSLQLRPLRPPPVAEQAVEVHSTVRAAFEGLSARLLLRDSRHGLSAMLPMMRSEPDRFTVVIPASFVQPAAQLSVRVVLVHEGEVIAAAPAVNAPASLLRIPHHRAALRIKSSWVGAEVVVAGRRVGHTPLAGLVPVEPGAVTITLRSAGEQTLEQVVSARRGEVTQVMMSKKPGISPLKITRYSLLGGGAALLATGTVLGVLARSSAQDVEKAVSAEPATKLPLNDFSSVAGVDSKGRALATGSIVALVTGGLAAAVGAVLFVWPRGDRSGKLQRSTAWVPRLGYQTVEVQF